MIDTSNQYNNSQSQNQNIILQNHPQLLPLLSSLNTLIQQNQLLNFIHRQNTIMNSQLIQQKIPAVQHNIQQLQLKQQQLMTNICNNRKSIQQKEKDIEVTRKKIQDICIEKRRREIQIVSMNQKMGSRVVNGNGNKSQRSIGKINNLRSQSTKNKRQISMNKHNTNKATTNTVPVIHNKESRTDKIIKLKNQILQNQQTITKTQQNKQNINCISNPISNYTQKQIINTKNNTSVLRLIQLNTNNQVLQNKINSKKKQIHWKMQRIEQMKKQIQCIMINISQMQQQKQQQQQQQQQQYSQMQSQSQQNNEQYRLQSQHMLTNKNSKNTSKNQSTICVSSQNQYNIASYNLNNTKIQSN